ncbi:MAG: hypothetical protein NVSMB27_44770 [Ktedonobacteraceae bacterium]
MTSKERTYPMNNSTIYAEAIVLGVLVLFVGTVFLTKVFGNHHALPSIAPAGEAILLIVGVVGMMVARRKGQV